MIDNFNFELFCSSSSCDGCNSKPSGWDSCYFEGKLFICYYIYYLNECSYLFIQVLVQFCHTYISL